MLKWPSQNWRSCKNSVYSCKVLRIYIVTNFLCSLSAEVDFGSLSAFVIEGQVVNDQKWYITDYYMKRWDRTDFTTLTLLLATETQTSLTF